MFDCCHRCQILLRYVLLEKWVQTEAQVDKSAPELTTFHFISFTVRLFWSHNCKMKPSKTNKQASNTNDSSQLLQDIQHSFEHLSNYFLSDLDTGQRNCAKVTANVFVIKRVFIALKCVLITRASASRRGPVLQKHLKTHSGGADCRDFIMP